MLMISKQRIKERERVKVALTDGNISNCADCAYNSSSEYYFLDFILFYVHVLCMCMHGHNFSFAAEAITSICAAGIHSIT